MPANAHLQQGNLTKVHGSIHNNSGYNLTLDDMTLKNGIFEDLPLENIPTGSSSNFTLRSRYNNVVWAQFYYTLHTGGEEKCELFLGIKKVYYQQISCAETRNEWMKERCSMKVEKSYGGSPEGRIVITLTKKLEQA